MIQRVWFSAFVLSALVASCTSKRAEPNAEPDSGTAGTDDGACVMILEDQDGDGVYGAPHCSPDGKPQTGIVLRRDDCDDADPNSYQLAYRDTDGDGFGAGDGTCVGDSLPAGTVLSHLDCNDADASIHPDAAEQWSDSVDSDCDGEDDPFSCSASPTLCGCAALAAPPKMVPVLASCNGADLSIESAEQCFACEDPSFASVVLQNAGTKAAKGVKLLLESDGVALPEIVIDGDLAAGAISKPINVRAPQGKLSLRAQTSTPQCDSSNDSFELMLKQSLCEP